MTRDEAISTTRQVITELNRRPGYPRTELDWAEAIVSVLIALEILRVE